MGHPSSDDTQPRATAEFFSSNSDGRSLQSQLWCGFWPEHNLHDSASDMIKPKRGRVEALMGPIHGELIACICIQGVQKVGVGHVVVETNATSVVQAVYTSSYDFSAMTNLISELRR